MSCALFPTEKTQRFRFDGASCLYRDFAGRRVVMDAEGTGFVRVVRSEPVLSVFTDRFQAKEFPNTFKREAIALAERDGFVEIEVAFGRSEPIQAMPAEHAGPLDGCGWVVGAGSPFRLDGRHEFSGEPSPEMPQPFFRSVDGDGPFQIIASEPIGCILADTWDIDDLAALAARQWRVQNMSNLRELASFYPDGTARTAQVASHLNVAAWKAAIPPDNEGLILRRTYDRFHGRQRSRVHVDGQFAGWWYDPLQDRDRRWHESDFGILPEFTKHKENIEIAIDPPSGTPLWSVSRMEIWALNP